MIKSTINPIPLEFLRFRAKTMSMPEINGKGMPMSIITINKTYP